MKRVVYIAQLAICIGACSHRHCSRSQVVEAREAAAVPAAVAPARVAVAPARVAAAPARVAAAPAQQMAEGSSTGGSTGQPENDKDRPAGEPKGATTPKASK